MDRRKFLTTVGAGATIGVAGCTGNGNGGNGNGNGNGGNGNGNGNGNGGGPDLGTLRANTPVPEGTAIANFVDRVAELAGEKSDGAIEIETFHGGQLGNAPESYESVSQGSLAFYCNGWPVAASYNQDLNGLLLPYGYRDYDSKMEQLYYDPPDIVGEIIEDTAESSDLRIIEGGGAMLGRRTPIANNELITTDDYQGQTIRSPASALYEAILGENGMGADTIQVPASEVGQGLSTGQIDILELPLEFCHAAGYYEQRDYLHNSAHIYNDACLWTNEGIWQDDMNDEFRGIMEESVAEASEWQLENLKSREETMIDEITDAGVTYLDDEIDQDQIQQSVQENVNNQFPYIEEIHNQINPPAY